ncbi:MAG: galactokinase [Ilumatobacteraceae bacterium]|jgi:galactokinase
MTDRLEVRVPGRVNLIGDHTDYTGGRALPMAIDRWTTITGQRSTQIEMHSSSEPGTARVPGDRPSSGWTRHVHACADLLAVEGAWSGLTGQISTDIPIGAGLSSSAALDIALALALGFSGSAEELIVLASAVEHRATGVPTGLLDQMAIVHGRQGHAVSIDVSSSAVEHVAIPDDLAIVVRHVLPRALAGSGYAERVAECAEVERRIGPLRLATLDSLVDLDSTVLERRARHVISENQRVEAAVAALSSGDGIGFGKLMDESHRSLRDDYECSLPVVDAAVDALRSEPGVLGVRMTGGGFGGCIVALCDGAAKVEGWRVRPVDGPL